MLKILSGIGRRLRAERERLELSQGDLAEKCGMSLMSQLRYETEQSAVTTPYLVAAQELGVRPAFVLFGEAEPDGVEWEKLERCVDDINQYCLLHWKDCPTRHRWVLVRRLYQRRVLVQPSRECGAESEIERLLGVQE